MSESIPSPDSGKSKKGMSPLWHLVYILLLIVGFVVLMKTSFQSRARVVDLQQQVDAYKAMVNTTTARAMSLGCDPYQAQNKDQNWCGAKLANGRDNKTFHIYDEDGVTHFFRLYLVDQPITGQLEGTEGTKIMLGHVEIRYIQSDYPDS